MSVRQARTRVLLTGAFCGSVVIVIAALAWLAHVVLELEREQHTAEAAVDFHRQIDLAMWRLDNLVAPVRAAEAARPLEHYNAFFSPAHALDPRGTRLPANTVLQPSPLLTAELPDWQLLHFHVSKQSGWSSPQVIAKSSEECADRSGIRPRFEVQRRALLEQLAVDMPPDLLLDCLGGGRQIPQQLSVYLRPADLQPPEPEQSAWQRDAQREHAARQNQQLVVNHWIADSPAPTEKNLESFFCPSELHRNAEIVGCDICVSALPAMPPMAPIWLPSQSGAQRLAFVRPVPIHGGLEVQGVLLDWPKLRDVLLAEVTDLFPAARLEPDPRPFERAATKMWNLPVKLAAGAPAGASVRGWTSLRIGLAFCSAAAVLALAAVGWGGWSLLELTERRQQFVSAVTHELRTPLTTLRLYLDMLANGMVHDERQREEYLQTLCAESDRLSHLIGDVLDYARLENDRVRPAMYAVPVADFLGELRHMLEPRCRAARKELVVECPAQAGDAIHGNRELLRQIVSNLVDNACKHSAGSTDPRVWVRVVHGALGTIAIEVEDRGPGIPSFERRAIFRSFWRGEAARAKTVSGAGLGLALAERWARLMGGSLSLDDSARGNGARFVLTLPRHTGPHETGSMCEADANVATTAIRSSKGDGKVVV